MTITCGTLPANAACSTGSTPPRTFSAPTDFAITIATDGKGLAVPASILPPSLSARGLAAGIFTALSLFTLAAARRRARRLHPGLLLLAATLSLSPLLGLTGCGGTDHNTPRGTYTIPLTITPSTGSATSADLTLVVQ